MLGKCLCGDIEFSVDIQTDPFKIYQCHCSLCKKQSGSSANSATIIEATHFKWIKSDNIKLGKKRRDLAHTFVQTVAVLFPMPLQVSITGYPWVY